MSEPFRILAWVVVLIIIVAFAVWLVRALLGV
jgi:hypothetical protein